METHTRIDPERISERIQRELKHGDLGIRELHRTVVRLLPTQTRGTSYGAILNYVHGKVRSPRLNILDAIAAGLGVRSTWLIHGEGERSEAQTKAAVVASSALPEADDLRHEGALGLKRVVIGAIRGQDGVETHDDPQSERDDLVPYWLAPVAEVWSRLMLHDEETSALVRDAVDRGPDRARERVWKDAIGEALRAPLDALRVHGGALDDEAIEEYVTSMLPALFRIVHERSLQVVKGQAA